MFQSIKQFYNETLHALDGEIGHVKDFYFESDGTIGHMNDFIINDKSWAICRLVVETGHWFSGKQILISLSKLHGISCKETKVFVNLTKEAIRQEPEILRSSGVASF
jgi:hypothetical protein